MGWANQLVMLVICLAIVVLSVTAGVMWWKRRPAGRLGVPPWPRERRAVVGVSLIVLVGGLLMPLTGLAIAAMIAVDLLVSRGITFLRRRPA